MTSDSPTAQVGTRNTRQKAAVLNLLQDNPQFCSAQQVHVQLVNSGEGIGLTTVYRILQALAGAGLVDVLRTDTEQLYRHCSPTHHHHLVCRSCSRTVEIEDRAVEQWAAQAAAEHGFREVTHTVEVFGICAECG